MSPHNPHRYTKELTLSNTSDIPMRFSWRVPEDEHAEPREMQVRELAVLLRVKTIYFILFIYSFLLLFYFIFYFTLCSLPLWLLVCEHKRALALMPHLPTLHCN